MPTFSLSTTADTGQYQRPFHVSPADSSLFQAGVVDKGTADTTKPILNVVFRPPAAGTPTSA
jgi:hypothetical protein